MCRSTKNDRHWADTTERNGVGEWALGKVSGSEDLVVLILARRTGTQWYTQQYTSQNVIHT